jgi:hypothetical protein
MFIQVIQGRCNRQDELKALAESWRTEVGEAPGWLGGTFGFTDDDQFVGVVRFESREAAMANSERPEQTAWAQKMAALMDGPMEFHDCDDVTVLLDGGSDDAGFVQVIRGRISDVERAKAMMSDVSGLRDMRPDIIGATLAIEPDGTFTETVSFTDEASARRGETLEPPEDMREGMDELLRDASFYDLHHPWFESAR